MVMISVGKETKTNEAHLVEFWLYRSGSQTWQISKIFREDFFSLLLFVGLFLSVPRDYDEKPDLGLLI